MSLDLEHNAWPSDSAATVISIDAEVIISRTGSNADGTSCMLSHGVRRNLPKLLAALRSGLLLLRLGPGGSGGLPERTARLGTCQELRDLPCRTRGGYFLATLFPMRFPIASLGRWRVLSRCDGWRFQPHTRFLSRQEVPPNPPVAKTAHPVMTLRVVLATPRD